MPSNIANAWPAVRAVLKDNYTFNEIKTTASQATFPVHQLSGLSQGSGGASKGQLMDGLDRLFNAMSSPDQHRAVVYCIAEIVGDVERAEEGHRQRLAQHFYGQPPAPPPLVAVRDRLEELLARFGWGLVGKEPVPLQLQVNIAATTLPDPVRTNLEKTLRRYRDGDITGAMTSACATVDALTSGMYAQYGLGDPHNDSYQECAVKAFRARMPDIERDLTASGMAADEATRTANNQRQAVSGAGYVLGSFRRNFADVHGIDRAPVQFVQRALDAAVFVIRSLVG